ncbi:coiled-coil domain-containing protein 115-like [Choristoneura fumiferana]|uniref:coiled-coil domain-containing protein 115-like n=1 Tax=Choristoneura fumiferana TaxID=7141 RepID=UPI003D154044
MVPIEDKNTPSLDEVSELLDKVALIQLHLMEEKINNEIIIESKIHEGSIHLAKSRYIMGQTAVSTARLPTESSPEFSASVHTKASEEKQFNAIESNDADTINPLRWFGILVPRNMHKAQEIFQSTITSVVECANIQFQISENIRNMNILEKFKKNHKSA